MKKILFVFGTRPEAIKLAPVIQAFRKDSGFITLAVSTGQHRQMLEQALSAFGLKADRELDIMVDNQTLFDVTANALQALKKLYLEEKPDMVMVQGDTTTAFAAALGAFYLKIPVGHVEAGLRSFDVENPFPEEANRIFIDRISSLYFAATPWARSNLLKEGVSAKKIFVTGNTVVDALRIIAGGPGKAGIRMAAAGSIPLIGEKTRLILLTSHRRENFGTPLEEICKAVRRIVERNPDVAVVYPVHLNPNVRGTVGKYLEGVERVHLIEPLNYADLSALLQKSYLALTDSGGIQEEAPYFGKPVLVLRKTTERPEGIKAGCAKLIGELKEKSIVSQVESLLKGPALYRRMAQVKNPYGDGKASNRILAAVQHYFKP